MSDIEDDSIFDSNCLSIDSSENEYDQNLDDSILTEISDRVNNISLDSSENEYDQNLDDSILTEISDRTISIQINGQSVSNAHNAADLIHEFLLRLFQFKLTGRTLQLVGSRESITVWLTLKELLQTNFSDQRTETCLTQDLMQMRPEKNETAYKFGIRYSDSSENEDTVQNLHEQATDGLNEAVVLEVVNGTPYDFYCSLIDNKIIDNIVDQTNLYATQCLTSEADIPKISRWHKWQPTDNTDIRRFIGLIGYIGLVKMPSMENYWSSSLLYRNDVARNTMSRNRFQLLLQALHFDDNEMCPPNDRLHKIQSGNSKIYTWEEEDVDENRKSEWIQAAADRGRFHRRIKQTEDIIGPVLTYSHRKGIYRAI
ncbi:Transposase IS4 [Popillia japonica]|uniref:Transposase IS4 n=1 Tax=Popillia japonica TaxID=7064 RepID=A0AAW1N3Q9_POPJA